MHPEDLGESLTFQTPDPSASLPSSGQMCPPVPRLSSAEGTPGPAPSAARHHPSPGKLSWGHHRLPACPSPLARPGTPSLADTTRDTPPPGFFQLIYLIRRRSSLQNNLTDQTRTESTRGCGEHCQAGQGVGGWRVSTRDGGVPGGTWAGWRLPALLLKLSESSKSSLQMGVRAGQSCFCEDRPGEEGQVGTPHHLLGLTAMGGTLCPPHPSKHPVSSDTTPLEQSPLSGSVLRH